MPNTNKELSVLCRLTNILTFQQGRILFKWFETQVRYCVLDLPITKHTRLNIHYSDFTMTCRLYLLLLFKKKHLKNKFEQKLSQSACKHFIRTNKYQCETWLILYFYLFHADWLEDLEAIAPRASMKKAFLKSW